MTSIKENSFNYFEFVKDFAQFILQTVLYYSSIKILQVFTTRDIKLIFLVWIIWIIFRLVNYVIHSNYYFRVDLE